MDTILALEGFVPQDHVAANFVVPIALVIFGGSIYMFLWANYGAKKGMAIWWVSLSGFCAMLGVFWWFGAPGTPVATGLQNFPGQAPDAYTGGWYGFEPGSERGQEYGFDEGGNPDVSFVEPAVFIGGEGATADTLDGNKKFAALTGDLQAAAGVAEAQFFPTDEFGSLRIASDRREDWVANVPEPAEGEIRADPFFSPVVDDTTVTTVDGIRVAKVDFRIVGTYLNEDFTVSRTFDVETDGVWYAFQDPGALWFPSAVWTGVSLLLFVLSLFWLDRIEMSEKEAEADEVLEAEDLAVPVAQ